jgi:hypothetical protein
MAARIEAAMSFPTIGADWVSRPLGDRPDANAGIVDVPAFRMVIDAFAGQFGRAPSRHGPSRQAIVLR